MSDGAREPLVSRWPFPAEPLPPGLPPPTARDFDPGPLLAFVGECDRAILEAFALPPDMLGLGRSTGLTIAEARRAEWSKRVMKGPRT